MRVGIVGVGFMGITHAAGWAATRATLAGFVAPAPDKAQVMAEQYDAQVYPDFEAMLAEVDVVDICTPTHLHYEMTLKAAAAGKHIICEKPLARTLAQGQEMIAACRSAGVKLLVAHVVRFFPEYAQAKTLVARGEIGQPAVIRLTRGTFRPKKATDNWFVDFDKSGGMMLDLMVHDFDVARWIAGEVEMVFAKNISSAHPNAPVDYGLAILKHRSGAISHVEGSWAYPPPLFRTRFEMAGSDGWLHFDSGQTAAIRLHLHQQKNDTPDVPLPSSPLLESPYTTQIKAFHEHLTNDAPIPVSAADGLAALQIALAASESAQRGVPVKLAALPEVSA
jgi:predicted dehydrogenase